MRSDRGSSERPSTKQDSRPVDPDAELRDRIWQVMRDMGIAYNDAQAMAMMVQAARLTPDDNEPAISTTRLFAAAVEIGQLTDSGSYSSALSKVVRRDVDLAERYRALSNLFKSESAEAALARLEPRWFSANVERIVRTAADTGAGISPIDAIVRSLIRTPAGLIRERIDLERVAAAVEVELHPPGKGSPQTLKDEVNALLEALKIPATEAVKLRLSWAAGSREAGKGTEELDWGDLIKTLVEVGQDTQVLSVNPTAMLKDVAETMGEEFTPRQAPVSDVPANPSNPLRFSKQLESLLQRGLSVQQRVFLNPALGTKGLIAAFLAEHPGGDNGWQQAVAIERFREIVRQRLPAEQARLWDRALERETRTVPRLNADQPTIGPPRDMLGITMDAMAIANVAAGQNTSLPLAFGIFGDWGAGKTFFMRLIQEHVAAFVKAPTTDDGFEHAIVQIQFNAWHYAETNLWASLVGHIFEELDRWMTRDQRSESTEVADAILKRLSTSRQLTLEAATELVQRRKDHAKAGAKLIKAQASLIEAEMEAAKAPGVVWRAVVSTAQAEIAKDDEIKQHLAGIQSTLAMPKLLENKAALTAAFEQLDRSASAGKAALGGLRATLGSGLTVALAIGALIGVPLFLFILHRVLNATVGLPAWAEIGRGFEALAGLLAGASVLIASFSNKAKALADKFVKLKATVDGEIAKATQAEREQAHATAAEVAKSAVAVEQAKTLVQATGEQVAVALKDYAEETGSLRISRFVRARAGADGYGRHLGLVSTIRKDFDQLQSLMLNRTKEPPAHLEEARKHYEARVDALIMDAGEALELAEIDQIKATAASMRSVDVPEAMAFRRIVLYIDDLDRCEPAKVVEVLQAVNMLLTFQLFVVMVAVDARWLSRSLEKQYPEFFGTAVSGDETRRRNGYDRLDKPDAREDGDVAPEAANNRNGTRRATTADYLEKIFQIPYWVPAMTPDTSRALVEDLVAGDRRESRKESGSSTDQAQTNEDPGSQSTSTPTAEDEQPATMEAPRESVGLTGDEINALTALAPYLGGSPRRARRFVNVYRVAKASLPRTEIKKLEEGDYKALATQLAIATGAPNLFAAWVDLCEKDDGSDVSLRLSALEASDDERQNLKGALAAFRVPAGNRVGDLKELAAQSARASRFSFGMPRKAGPPMPPVKPVAPAS